MSATSWPFVRQGARAFAVVSLLLVVGCGGESQPDHGTDSLGAQGDLSPSAGEPVGAPSYEVIAGSQASAQKVLAAAEAAFLASPSGRYRVAWLLPGGARTVVRAEFDGAIPAGRQVIRGVNESQLETLLIEADSWSRPTVEGKTADCWIHFSQGTSEQARMSAFLPGAYPLLEPEAVGFLEDGSKRQVVVEVLLDEAVPIAGPKLANQLRSAIDPDATVRGVVTLAGGEYKSLEYSMADVIADLEDSELGAPEELRGMLETSNGAWTVRVDYSDFGASVTISPPASASVIEAGSPDEPSQDSQLPNCQAAH